MNEMPRTTKKSDKPRKERSRPTNARRLDDTMLALSDPTRRAILERLRRGEARVTDLAQPFRMSLNSVSKHIRVLERAKLVRRRRSGREHLLSFNRTPLDEAAKWIERQRAFWNARLDALEHELNKPPTD
jgi:DNA-binding transcriptional ArsR family regulator